MSCFFFCCEGETDRDGTHNLKHTSHGCQGAVSAVIEVCEVDEAQVLLWD